MLRWWACHESEVPAGLGWLTPPERERASRQRFTKRRTEYLLRRYAGKGCAAAVLAMPLEESSLARIGVLNRPGGAPHVVVDGVEAAVDISLTDRAGAAVALAGPVGTMAAGTLGVDLEIVEPRSEGFVADYLTGAEQEWVRAMRDARGEEGWQVAANLVWSAKEAALKVLRVGLRADTRSVEVRVDDEVGGDGWARLSVLVPTAGLDLPGWWRRDGAYLLTVAARDELAPPRLLPGSADLAAHEPQHSWLVHPLVDPEQR